MNNNDILKKKIIYNSHHRGFKEMDLILGSFANKYIDSFSIKELYLFESLLKIDDEILFKWYLNKNCSYNIPKNSVSKKLKVFCLKETGGGGGIRTHE